MHQRFPEKDAFPSRKSWIPNLPCGRRWFATCCFVQSNEVSSFKGTGIA